jgi:predicted small lipoprotein YifL
MKKALLVLIALMMLIAGAASCGKYIPESSTPSGGDLNSPTPDESTFNFILNYGTFARNEIDTYRDKFTKDMVIDPPITVDLRLTEEEMDRIYQKMVEIDFFSYPEEFRVTAPPSGATTIVTPYSSYYYTVEKDSQIKKLRWGDEIMNPDEKADKLRELYYLIMSIIESREEYKALPEPRSGYL